MISGAPAQPLAVRRAPTGELVALWVRGGCPCPGSWRLEAAVRPAGQGWGTPEVVTPEVVPNPYAWLVLDARDRLALAAYDFGGRRLTVAARPY